MTKDKKIIKWEFTYPCSDLFYQGEIEVDENIDEGKKESLIAEDIGLRVMRDGLIEIIKN